MTNKSLEEKKKTAKISNINLCKMINFKRSINNSKKENQTAGKFLPDFYKEFILP